MAVNLSFLTGSSEGELETFWGVARYRDTSSLQAYKECRKGLKTGLFDMDMDDSSYLFEEARSCPCSAYA